MINLLKKFFDNHDTKNINEDDNLELLCGIMIEAANSDGKIDKSELEHIEKILVDIFKEDQDSVKNVLVKALQNKDNSKSLFYYTSKINKNYPMETKILLIETLWEIILSDGNIHDYESSLIRRLAGLLYISDVNSGNARKRALNNISNIR